jgi:FHA domain-containing protein
MRIKVISYNGLPPVQPISAEIGEQGGSIGRDDSNTLVLPDLAKHISRLHAAITFRGGNFVIQDRGTVTPVYVNGQELGNGQETVIVAGYEIAIGGFKLRVMDGNAPSGNLDQSYAPPRPPAAVESPKDDPLAMFGTSSTTVNPFADLLAPATSYKQAKDDTAPLKNAFGAPAATSSSSIIPLDFDPFSDFKPTQPLAQPTSPVRPAVEVDHGPLTSTAAPGIDELFGLGSSTGRDPFALGNPLAEPLHQPVVAHSVDPLVALDAASADKITSGIPPLNDAPALSSEVRTSEKKLGDTVRMFHAPARPDKPARLSPQAQNSASAPQPSGMLLSWESAEPSAGVGEIKSVVVPSPKSDRGEQARTEVQLQKPSATKPVVVEEKPVTSHAGEAASHNELLQAFLAGAGVPNLALPGKLTPEMMNMFGQLLREATQGTLDLLLARALTKQEVRADATMIVGKENNPLKFSPSVEVALSHLLAPQGYGFMMPKQSMKDAYNDLRSHQFGFMAGMRAALTGVLERFNPGRLEQRLTQKKLIDSILPMQRKAKLWDLFAELYGDISKEAEEDFHELFGKAFLRAYEEQIDKLRQEDKSRKS